MSVDHPVTPAVRLLREKHIAFTPHLYSYEEHGGTRASAEHLKVDEHMIVKTLVFQTDLRKPLLVLMHGDREVSTKQLARFLDVKSVTPCDEATAQRHTGYLFGGTSPFGTRAPLPVYAEHTIFDLQRIFINGGKRGFLVEIAPDALRRAFDVTPVTVAIPQ
jgi:Cys-tRNA(Pro) deacylase